MYNSDMAENQQIMQPEDVASTSSGLTTVTPQQQAETVEPPAVLTLQPKRDHPRKKVGWSEDTIDNENMTKKKSKCCCIFQRHKQKFEDTDSESSEAECEHCLKHVERRKKNRRRANRNREIQQITSTEQDSELASPDASTSTSVSPDVSASASTSVSPDVSASVSVSPDASASVSVSPDASASASVSPDASASASTSDSPDASPERPLTILLHAGEPPEKQHSPI
ncbi:uncharacterized protein LOC131841434 isoform X1 [Achroia grisella]|uniref:uncharacterized protein LOC131841434 isoform X1 n=1 Tax=Achroia grisella TaxID=688607 RepID=UPI0027D2F9D8|nr:uncharacterized protein LOC131841434 isoform X1 [Achroia grisella]